MCSWRFYRNVHIPNVFCDGHFSNHHCAGIFQHDPKRKIRHWKRILDPNGLWCICLWHSWMIYVSHIERKPQKFYFLYIQRIQNIVTVHLRVENPREKMGPTMCLYNIPWSNYSLSTVTRFQFIHRCIDYYHNTCFSCLINWLNMVAWESFTWISVPSVFPNFNYI